MIVEKEPHPYNHGGIKVEAKRRYMADNSPLSILQFSFDHALPSANLPSLVGQLSKEDLTLLASEFTKKGALTLLHGDRYGIQLFDSALHLCPPTDTLLLNQALALFEFGSHSRDIPTLRLACKRFKMADKLKPNSLEILHGWGSTLLLIGQISLLAQDFSLAKEKLEKATECIKNHSHDVLADLYWDLGSAWYYLGKESEEAFDFKSAVNAFDLAATYVDSLPTEFWHIFGKACQELSRATGDLGMLTKGIHSLKNALSLSISSHTEWVTLAQAVAELYSYTQDEDHFSQANECFSTAMKFNNGQASAWTAWAELLFDSGIQNKDTKKLSAAMEKCHKALLCEPNNPKNHAIFAKAQASLGLFSDRLSLIHSAQNKLAEVSFFKASQDYFLAEGITLSCLGEYFQDLDYHYQSIERFQEGLSINRKNHKLWFALGKGYLSSAHLEGDLSSYEKAYKFFTKALHLHISSTYHYHAAIALYKIGELSREEVHIHSALYHFEQALHLQKNALYLHPEWLFEYAVCLDAAADYSDDDQLYSKSLEILNHVLMVDPDFPMIHHQIAVVFGHFADLASDQDLFQRSIHHYKIAFQKEKENDQILLDWALTLMSYSCSTFDTELSHSLRAEAEAKIMQAARLGNTQASYHLACLYSLLSNYDLSLFYLNKAFHLGVLPSLQDLLQDEWLDNVRITQEFRSFIEKIELSSLQQE